MTATAKKTRKVTEKQVKPRRKAHATEDIFIPQVNIGLVGHVDHGKTSLTAALTGKWTDTHSEEVKRGITIRLGYHDVTFYKCAKCTGHAAYSTAATCLNCSGKAAPLRTVSFVDAPGHETLMTTVLSGAALMDGALLVIAANEPCPQPQTREHLSALDIVGIRNIIVVQNKIDLVTNEQALENYQQIQKFLKGSVAENAPIIPVSAHQKTNLDAVVEAIETVVPTPKRDSTKAPTMLIARSFDTNRPGTPIEKLRGGVVGGSLLEGELKVGEKVEIRPGVMIKDSFTPVLTEISGLQKAQKNLGNAGPGGLVGVQTLLDPFLTKSDSLSGNVLGLPGKLPPVLNELAFTVNLMERVVGTKQEIAVEPIKTGDNLMLVVGITRTIGAVSTASGKKAHTKLKIPICANKGERVAISRQVMGRWRLIGWGEIV